VVDLILGRNPGSLGAMDMINVEKAISDPISQSYLYD
jgi:hypothetical protein